MLFNVIADFAHAKMKLWFYLEEGNSFELQLSTILLFAVSDPLIQLLLSVLPFRFFVIIVRFGRGRRLVCSCIVSHAHRNCTTRLRHDTAVFAWKSRPVFASPALTFPSQVKCRTRQNVQFLTRRWSRNEETEGESTEYKITKKATRKFRCEFNVRA